MELKASYCLEGKQQTCIHPLQCWTKLLPNPVTSKAKKKKHVFHQEKCSVPFFAFLLLWKYHPVFIKVSLLKSFEQQQSFLSPPGFLLCFPPWFLKTAFKPSLPHFVTTKRKRVGNNIKTDWRWSLARQMCENSQLKYYQSSCFARFSAFSMTYIITVLKVFSPSWKNTKITQSLRNPAPPQNQHLPALYVPPCRD